MKGYNKKKMRVSNKKKYNGNVEIVVMIMKQHTKFAQVVELKSLNNRLEKNQLSPKID